jgi:hypothetical protein
MEKLYVVLKRATFDHLPDETFPLRFGTVPHAHKEKEAASDDGNEDNNENQSLPTLG